MKARLASMKEKIGHFFLQQPLPLAAFQLSSRYLSGLRVSPPDRKIKHHFVLPFQGGVLNPSFYKKNMKDSSELDEKMKEGISKLQLAEHKVVFLLPELSQKSFIFSFDSLPTSQRELEQILLFRIKKQIPVLPEDTRLSFDVLRSNTKKKVLVTIARESVVREYEDFFNKFQLKVRAVGVPSLSLYNLVGSTKDEDYMLIDVENDSFSLLGVINSEVTLYRQKHFAEDFQDEKDFDEKWRNVVQEIENTANFIEDKEERKICCYWVRFGVFEPGEEALGILRDQSRCPVNPIESALSSPLPSLDKKLLSPLIGQIL
ncbi:hypothetical protein ACFLT2_00230 [Acidobacteriota bacterium]